MLISITFQCLVNSFMSNEVSHYISVFSELWIPSRNKNFNHFPQCVFNFMLLVSTLHLLLNNGPRTIWHYVCKKKTNTCSFVAFILSHTHFHHIPTISYIFQIFLDPFWKLSFSPKSWPIKISVSFWLYPQIAN